MSSAAHEKPTTEAFRAEARAWLADNLVRSTEGGGDGESAGPAKVAADKVLQARIFDGGFAGITWPKAYGGQGLTDAEMQAWVEEAAGYVQPGIYDQPFGVCGPTIVDLGSEEQKQRYIPKLLRGEEVWCQLFSEPGAGSDVAGLTTRAERDGDEWVVNGQKVWTSGAQHSDFGTLIARTDPSVPKHNGISMFIVDMRTPGLTVRPLRTATGETPFNEVYFDNVRLPADALLGEENGGWAATVLMLRHERIYYGTIARPPVRALSYGALLALARKDGRSRDPLVRDRLAWLYALDTAGDLLSQRMRQEVDAGQELRARGSIAKLAGAVITRQAIDAFDEVVGSDAVVWAGPRDDYPTAIRGMVGAPAQGIAGGSNEIQRGIIGERVLGLAKDPQLDREIPFSELRRIPAARVATNAI
ncbi:MAG: Acyl-CoA dehydrogenase [Jatrophihabitantaceae bacterium]|nr:Acyl-CoA dehydrogenase [Jatrophihabitantaceae bacterium]